MWGEGEVCAEALSLPPNTFVLGNRELGRWQRQAGSDLVCLVETLKCNEELLKGLNQERDAFKY